MAIRPYHPPLPPPLPALSTTAFPSAARTLSAHFFSHTDGTATPRVLLHKSWLAFAPTRILGNEYSYLLQTKIKIYTDPCPHNSSLLVFGQHHYRSFHGVLARKMAPPGQHLNLRVGGHRKESAHTRATHTRVQVGAKVQ